MTDAKPDLLLIGSATPYMRDRMAEDFTVHSLPSEAERESFFAEVGPKIVAVTVYGGAGLPGDVMDRLPNLRVISNYGVGYDAVDTPRAVARGILISHTPDVLNDEVANTAILLWLATSRKLAAYDAYVRAGRWASEGNPALTRGTQGRTVGIIGMGRIGQAIAARLPVFGARILYHARSARDLPYEYFADLTEMARQSEVLICITPGGPATRHLVNAEVIEALGPEGILVNVSRGTVVDEEALVAALLDGRLGGAGLDVFENEPQVPEALFAMENVTLQPHIGSASEETRRAMGDLACDNLVQFLKDGTVLTPVPECREMNAKAAG